MNIHMLPTLCLVLKALEITTRHVTSPFIKNPIPSFVIHSFFCQKDNVEYGIGFSFLLSKSSNIVTTHTLVYICENYIKNCSCSIVSLV